MGNSVKFILGGLIVIVILLLGGFINAFGLILLTLLVGVIGALIVNSENETETETKRTVQKKEDPLGKIENFTVSKKMIYPKGIIAIDQDRRELLLKEIGSDIERFYFTDIRGCEIEEDGKISYQKSNAIGRAIVGGVIAGEAGAIVGGLSAKEIENKEVSKLLLKVLVNDLSKPSYKVCFFDAWDESNRSKRSVILSDQNYQRIYNNALESIHSWKDTIDAILDQNNSAPKQKESAINVSDELIKLNELREKGILTDQEFDDQKKKVLA